MDWLKKSLAKIWEEILKNLGVVIFGFVASGGYLAAIKYLESFRDLIRAIPSDWFLTPLVLLLIAVGVLTRISYKQHREITRFKAQRPSREERSRLVTHLGVWWRVYPDSKYIEDFPYCPCCEPPKKLIQIEWFEDEVYKCPHSGTEVKLYDRVPRKRNDVLQSLYNTYFRETGLDFYLSYQKEVRQQKELHPDRDEQTIFEELLQKEPLSNIPDKEREEILARYPEADKFIHYLHRHYDRYAKYIEKPSESET